MVSQMQCKPMPAGTTCELLGDPKFVYTSRRRGRMLLASDAGTMVVRTYSILNGVS